MDPNVLATVNWLTTRISKLQNLKKMLLEEASRPKGGGEAAQIAPSVRRAKAATKHARPDRAKKTRKRAMIDFIREGGPATRREIIEGTGIPMGTVAYCLNDKKTFIRSDDGRWDVRKETKPAEVVQHQKAG